MSRSEVARTSTDQYTSLSDGLSFGHTRRHFRIKHITVSLCYLRVCSVMLINVRLTCVCLCYCTNVDIYAYSCTFGSCMFIC